MKRSHSAAWVGVLGAVLQACACGVPTPSVAVAIAPTEVTVETGKSATFSASVSGAADPSVTWSVLEDTGGAITGGGVYTAPVAPGTFHVIAANSGVKATATVTVVPATAAGLTLTPTAVTVGPGQTQQFTAALDGTALTAASWSVQEAGGGTVSASGLYTAPTTPGTFHVSVALLADPTRTATATVTVSTAGVVAVTLSPPSASLLGGDTLPFAATVTGAADTSVTFSLVEITTGGTVQAAGPATALYTAPFAAGVYHLLATSNADSTKVASAAITVAARPITVSVSPAQASVAPGGTQQFAATVSGTANMAVTWSVTGGGTVSSSGLYTAPSTAGTNDTVTATSVADGTKAGAATVLVIAPGGNVVTGTVAYAGTRPGRIYISVESTTLGTLAGTSLAAPGTFTIRGVQANGAVTVRAWRDALGTATYNGPLDPVGSAALTVPQSGALTVTLADPAASTPPKPVQPPYVVGTAGAAAVFYDAVYNQTTGAELADHYRIYWSTTANPGPANKAGLREVKAGGNGFAVLFDATLASGSYFFSTSSVVNGVESAVTATAAATTMAQPANGSTLSGTVTGFAATDPLLILALGQFGNGYTIAAAKIANPTASQAFSLTKVPKGDYTLYAWVDSGDNGDWDPVDVGNFTTAPAALSVNGAPNQTVTANTTLPSGNALTKAVSEHSKFFGVESWGVEHTVLTNQKQVVAVSVDSGPNLAGPLDVAMQGGAAHVGNVNTNGVAPTTGAPYSYTLTFSDGSTATVTAPVSAVLTGLPTPTSPTATASTSPTFTWTAPSPAPTQAPYTWNLYLYDENSQFSGYATQLPASTTSLPFSALSYAPQSLTAAVTYYWYLYTVDADGNRSASSAYFTAQ